MKSNENSLMVFESLSGVTFDHVALHGDHGDVVVAPAAGLVDAYRLHARVSPRRATPHYLI